MNTCRGRQLSSMSSASRVARVERVERVEQLRLAWLCVAAECRRPCFCRRTVLWMDVHAWNMLPPADASSPIQFNSIP